MPDLKREIAQEILKAVHTARAPISGAEQRAIDMLVSALDRALNDWPKTEGK